MAANVGRLGSSEGSSHRYRSKVTITMERTVWIIFLIFSSVTSFLFHILFRFTSADFWSFSYQRMLVALAVFGALGDFPNSLFYVLLFFSGLSIFCWFSSICHFHVSKYCLLMIYMIYSFISPSLTFAAS